MAGTCESLIVPPQILLCEPQPELLRCREGTRVITSSKSQSQSGSWSGNNNEISVLSRGEPQATRGDCGYGTEFGRRRGVGVCPQVRRCLKNRGCVPGRTQRYGEIVSCCKGTLCLKRGVGSRRGARYRKRRFQSATQLLGENTNDCLGWLARLDYLFELAPQIREGNLLRLLDHSLLVCLRYLLAHDLDMIVSTVVIVTDFAAGKRISDIEIEGLLRAGRNVCQLDCENKAVHGAIGKGLLLPRGDLVVCHLTSVKRTAIHFRMRYCAREQHPQPWTQPTRCPRQRHHAYLWPMVGPLARRFCALRAAVLEIVTAGLNERGKL